MGDSDDDYQSHNAPVGHNMSTGSHNNNGNNNNNSANHSNNNSNFNNSNKKNNGRDKFYRERDDSNNSNYQRNNDNRRDWNNGDRGSRGNDSYKNNRMGGQSYGGGGGYGHSNQGGMSGAGYRGGGGHSDYPKKYSHQSPGGHHNDASPPPYKRNRKDYEDSGRTDSYSSPQVNYNQSSHHQKPQQGDSDYPTQPPFLSFKLFLQQQNDDISDEEAIKRYNDYKMDFKKTQINNFFLEHKEEEWFKLRYHPDENFKRHNEQNQFVLNRLEVFMDLMNKGWLENVAIETDKSKDIIKFLDAVVIRLEGGGDAELELLNAPPQASKVDEDGSKTEKENETPKEQHGEAGEDADTNNQNGKKRKQGEDSGSESGAYTESDNDGEDSGEKNEKRKRKTKSRSADRANLHKTCSIFMRNLAPSSTKQDLENLCKEYEGFKRVAISDPAPERGFFRRGWITFESNVDVKKICWNLQNTKIKDFNPGAIVNRELTNRIRPVSGSVSHHKSVVKNDIKLAMRIIQNMDKRWGLWREEGDEDEEMQKEEDDVEMKEIVKTGDEKTDSENTEIANLEKTAFSAIKSTQAKFLSHRFNGANPLFTNITDYLVDEVDAEEQELLGENIVNSKPKSTSATIDLELDPDFKSVLDKLLLYLRVVHSFDFYNSTEYQQEDSMPNRCGIMFARPSVTSSQKTTQDEVNQYIKQFETKMKPYVEYKEHLDKETAKKLGVKDRKKEVEKFIENNTQMLAVDRWLCPLSGKKFKGPEFIRKHLFYKHMDKIAEVKKEVEYFNNYVIDPKRPQLPEHQTNKPGSGGQIQQQQHSGQFGAGQPGGYPGNMPGYGNQMGQMGNYNSPMQNRPMTGYNMQMYGGVDMMQQNSGGYGNQFSAGYNQGGYQMNRGGRGGYGNINRGGGRGGRDSREMMSYKDLDAPEDN